MDIQIIIATFVDKYKFMQINPKDVKEMLKTVLGKDVSITDYTKPTVLHGEYSKRGISVMGYKYPHHVCVQFRTNGDVYFNIEAEEREIVTSIWKAEDVDESTYEYFIFILKTHINNRNSIAEHADKFNSKYWIKRNKQLSKIL